MKYYPTRGRLLVFVTQDGSDEPRVAPSRGRVIASYSENDIPPGANVIFGRYAGTHVGGEFLTIETWMPEEHPTSEVVVSLYGIIHDLRRPPCWVQR